MDKRRGEAPGRRSESRLPVPPPPASLPAEELAWVDRAIEAERYDEAWERVRALLVKDPANEEAKLRRLYLEALEQRRARRVRRDMVLFLERPDGTDWPCRLVDISEGGLRIRSARGLTGGEDLRLVLKQPAPHEPGPHVPCRVAWSRADPRGCVAGLEFAVGTEGDQRCLRRLLEIALSPRSRSAP